MSRERFERLCQKAMELRGLDKDPRYIKRLKWEVEEIVGKEKWDYFLDLLDRRVKYPKNQNNLLVPYLFGIVADHDIDHDPNSVFTGDLPDIDVDYIDIVRDYLKNEWAPKTFGEEYVCNIGNYTTFGLKNALIDMARLHDNPRDEIQAITKSLDAKDEEGKPMTWDSALKLHPELKEYIDRFPEVGEAAKKIMHRNRGMGVHAGGLIISSIPLHDLVPLVKRKDDPQASSWVEGLHGQDLQPVGLVKFDLLVISNLMQIARCCQLVKERHGLDGICAMPGGPDWSDVPRWRNDPEALAMAGRGDLKCVFQFDSEGMRALVKSGGVTRFEDLIAYSALFRPGCLKSGMTKRYVDRKKGLESFDMHPLMQPILEKTYGIMVYQEQIMQILHVVGNIPLKDCEAVRKAISKKKIENFIKYKQMFIQNGMKNLGVAEAEVEELWNQVEAFSEYGFNLSHACAYTYISMWLIYLKCHYPHEFYASMLTCEKLSEKIKDYKMEARVHGVEMCRLDINKSKENFTLQGDQIHFGFSKVKGIGDGPAKRIVSGQPYKNFEDFLYRCGTDASMLKPIIGLRCFKDRDPITLWKFAEHFKEAQKKGEAKKKRFVVSLARYEEQFKALCPDEKMSLEDFAGENPFETDPYWKNKYDKDEFIEKWKEVEAEEGEGEPRIVMEDVPTDDDAVVIEREALKYYKKIRVVKEFNRFKELKTLWNKRKRTLAKGQMPLSALPKLVDFCGDDHRIANDLLKELRDPVVCEEKFYGFPWIHELERSPDYQGNLTFDALRNDINQAVAPVEMRIKSFKRLPSRKGNMYTQVIAEDVTGQVNKINVWDDDWARWEQEFQVGNLLRVRLQPPSGGFPTFTLESNQIKGRYWAKRYPDKEMDFRVVVMQFGKTEQEMFLTDDEVLDQFGDCSMDGTT